MKPLISLEIFTLRLSLQVVEQVAHVQRDSAKNEGHVYKSFFSFKYSSVGF